MLAMVGAHSASCASVADGNCLFDIGHHLVELMDGVVPLLRVEVVEGLVVVAAELRGFFAVEVLQRALIPEDQVIGELADGVVALAVGPARLLRCEVGDSDVGADEPVALVMGAVQLVKQDGFQRRCGLLRLRLRSSIEGEGQCEREDEMISCGFLGTILDSIVSTASLVPKG